ncbi:MAG TPA: prepilin-type N-terminal cleavage/methylation domain-containing protein [Bacillota bacterium]|nr:prepilin-type N-terminal cleavage/methylation domain-containing protein [Bacillota bacterium]
MPQRILGTGNRFSKGFTLLEVLGIIVLLGLAASLAYPNFTSSQEKIKLQYMGKLVRADLQLARENAVSEQTGNTVRFNRNSYDYKIGGRTIERSLVGYGFGFNLDAAEEITTGVETAASPLGTVAFAPDGSCGETTLNWKSDHFQGSLMVRSDGTVSWQYAGKK